MWLLYIFIGIVIGGIGMLFINKACMQDERNNHREMYNFLMGKRIDLLSRQVNETLKEYEDRFLL